MTRILQTVALFATLSGGKAADPVTSGTNVQVWPCTPVASSRQTWLIANKGPPYDNILLGGAAGIPPSGLTLNTLGYSNSTSGVLNVWTQVPSTPWGQQWVFDEQTGYLSSVINGLCAGSLNSSGVLPAGTAIVQVVCAAVGTVTWTYNSTTGQFVWSNNPSLCLDAGTSVSCVDESLSSFPYCNSSLGVAERVSDLIARLEVRKSAARDCICVACVL
jgi:hypothetical protein